MTERMAISDITIPADRMRPLGDVEALAESIAQNGLINPITVGKDRRLISGLHRLEACKRLGWTDIPVNITDLEGMQAELAEIDENLVRSELTVLQQADHLARRVEILEALKQRAPGHRPEKSATLAPLRTTAEIAAEMGMSKRSAQVRLQIARDVLPEVKEVIAGTELADRTTYLLEIAQTPPDRQMAAAKRFWGIHLDPDGEALKQEGDDKPELTVGDVAEIIFSSREYKTLTKEREVIKRWDAVRKAIRVLREIDPEGDILLSQWKADHWQMMISSDAKDAQEWLGKVQAKMKDPRSGIRLA